MMAVSPSSSTNRFANAFPFVVLLLAPEIINGAVWTFWFVVGSINEGSFGRTAESNVGLGVIALILTYLAMGAGGLSTLAFLVWRLVKGVRTARGLRGRSERWRRTMIATNLAHVVFIVVALALFNYCDLPARGDGYRDRYSESSGRRVIQGLDVLVLSYGVAAIFFFTRPRVAEQFGNP